MACIKSIDVANSKQKQPCYDPNQENMFPKNIAPPMRTDVYAANKARTSLAQSRATNPAPLSGGIILKYN